MAAADAKDLLMVEEGRSGFDLGVDRIFEQAQKMYESDLITGTPSIVTRKEFRLNTRIHHPEMKPMLSLQLNLNIKHSNPRSRSMLFLIKAMLGLMNRSRDAHREMQTYIEDFPQIDVADYAKEVYFELFHGCIYERLRVYCREKLSQLLTAYLEQVSNTNDFGHRYDDSIHIHFGANSNQTIVCCSDV